MSDATASQASTRAEGSTDESRPSASSVASEERPGGRWWYLIAAVPVVYSLTLALAPMFTVSVVLGNPIPTASVFFSPKVTILVLGTPAFLVTLSLPMALHRDIANLSTAAKEFEWSPDRETWVLHGAAGLFVPGFAPVVATYYLFRRFQHAGL